jgi:hypothetical protein
MSDNPAIKRVKPRHTGQGRVKDPQKDGRLRENRERGIRKTKPETTQAPKH